MPIDDTAHDHHTVNTLTRRAISSLQSHGISMRAFCVESPEDGDKPPDKWSDANTSASSLCQCPGFGLQSTSNRNNSIFNSGHGISMRAFCAESSEGGDKHQDKWRFGRFSLDTPPATPKRKGSSVIFPSSFELITMLKKWVVVVVEEEEEEEQQQQEQEQEQQQHLYLLVRTVTESPSYCVTLTLHESSL
ncbi:hypothetical protein PoB_000307900 [Plakobranchus ocellatus]|uniref:Uncharacterized protein n=1 Tax=Plakobranchus ocellatus TaxID=259542 RepID=A0AAV3Y0V5_9GAST|nr:hypothetical protein PoB_000307900 [Plakobranchus ocellatus]